LVTFSFLLQEEERSIHLFVFFPINADVKKKREDCAGSVTIFRKSFLKC
jgi:biotin synthase-related radical SAM superfamily protein